MNRPVSFRSFRASVARLAVAGLLAGGAFSALPAAAKNKPLDAKLIQLDGSKVKLSDLRGKPLLLEMWATWCLPCREQAEVLHQLDDVLAERGVAVYAVDVGEKTEVVAEHLERTPSAYPVLLDPVQTLASRLRIAELPALVLLRADGTVAATVVGLTRRDGVLELLEQLAVPGAE